MLSFLIAITLNSAPSYAWQPAKDCRANIARVTCRVAPQSKEEAADPRVQRRCLGGENVYANELIKVHDDLPPKLKKMFCHLRRIYIEVEFYGSGYAGKFPEVFKDEKNSERVRFNGNVLGLSVKKVFESNYNLSEWLSRKEQTFFGRQMDDPPSTLMPVIESQYTGIKSRPLLLSIIIHEFGHMLDEANNINSWGRTGDLKCTQLENEDQPECKPGYIGLWPAISWRHDGTIRHEDRYYGDYRPCSYKCGKDKTAPLENAGEIYRAFIAGNAFVSLYASVNTLEDFAESFLYYISAKYFGPENQEKKTFSVQYTLPGGEPAFMDTRLSRGRLYSKMVFMEMFDAGKWKYQVDGERSYSLEEYLKFSPLL